MISNKKILLVCKETFSYPLFYVAEEFKKRGNDVAVFFILSEESTLNQCKYNKNSYFLFKKYFDTNRFFDVKDISECFLKNYKTPKIDYEYLRGVECKYGKRKNLNLQLISSQFTSRCFHTRSYFKFSNNEQNLYWIELNYKKIEEIMQEYNPDIILDLDNAELQRTILNEVCYVLSKPYITIEYPRYLNYKIPTFNLGLWKEQFFKDTYEKYMKKDSSELVDASLYIEEFRGKSNIMSEEYSGDITSKYKQDGIWEFMKNQYRILRLLFDTDIINRNAKYRLKDKKCIIFSNPIKHYLFLLKVELKKQILYRDNKYFDKPMKDGKYVYMPLHLIPESTTFVKAPYYINEEMIIQQISKSLPLDWKLYVKEHQAMLGERELSFYKRISKLPNVKVVQLNHYKDPKPWILNSQGVITITGTSAYEAALLGKPAIVFGNTPFNVIDGITEIKSFEDLPSEIHKFKNRVDNLNSCAAYIECVKELGVEINIKYLISRAGEIINNNESPDEKFKNEINNVVELYNKAYDIYNENLISRKGEF